MREGFLYAYHNQSWKKKPPIDRLHHFWHHFRSCENSSVSIWQSEISMGLYPALGDDWKQSTTSNWWAGMNDDREIMELNCEEPSSRVCVRVVHQSDAQEQRKSVLLAKNIGGRVYHAKKCQNNHCITMVPNTKICHVIHQPYILEWWASALQQKLLVNWQTMLKNVIIPKANKRWYDVKLKSDWPKVPQWDVLQMMDWNANTVREYIASGTKVVV